MKAIALFITALLVSYSAAAEIGFNVDAITACVTATISIPPAADVATKCSLLTLLGVSTTTSADDIKLTGGGLLTALFNLYVNGTVTAKTLQIEQDLSSTVQIGQGAILNLAEGLSVAGKSSLVVAGNIVAGAKSTFTDTATFVANSGAAVSFNGGVDVAAGGAFTVNTGATVNINGDSAINGAANFAENSYLNIKTGITTFAANVASKANTTVNSALVVAATGAAYAQNAGTLVIDGAAAVINASVTIANNAWLKGNGGSINGNLNVAAGGGVAVGNSPGTQYVNGNFVLGTTSTFDLEIASTTSYDKLIVRGTSSLDGILAAHLLNDYKPPAGEKYSFITSVGAVSGKFNIVRGDSISTLGAFSVEYNSNSVNAYYQNSAATAVASFFLIAVAFAFATL